MTKLTVSSLTFLMVIAICIAGIQGQVVVSTPAVVTPQPTGQLTSSQPKCWPLDGPWLVSLDNGQTHRKFQVPAPVEDQLDPKFDGISQYTRKIPNQPFGDNERLLLYFEAVATRAKVFVEDELVGEHLGGWTPFDVDISEVALKHRNKDELDLRVEVDELVGHNTQGFLPIIIPHFGGIWQHVYLVRAPETRIDWFDVLATAAAIPEKLVIQFPVIVGSGVLPASIEVATRQFLISDKSRPEFAVRKRVAFVEAIESTNARTPPDPDRKSLRFELPYEDADDWTPERPIQIQVLIKLLDKDGGVIDQYSGSVCNRTFTAEGPQLKLNGQPVNVRGVLNWGYSPPSYAPSIDEKWMRQEIQFAKDRGFNLMKFCLWIPPKRYLELCDEMGMMAWVEYPTWHPQLDQQHLTDLQIEYEEFFRFDRNHPSVVLRSLTCETGPSADINVIRDLTNRCKAAIPGAVVEDDSSWIAWNRITDFYDDHPYGNNHTWVKTLTDLKDYIAKHDEKPLVLGEAIAADTWLFPEDVEICRDNPESPHAPWAASSNAEWFARMHRLAAANERTFYSDNFAARSRHYAMFMRKYQIETYRREVPNGGYVVSVIRDFPKASMGLIDFNNEPKTSGEQWDFHSERMLLLETPYDRRSFRSGQEIIVRFIFADMIRAGQDVSDDIEWSLHSSNKSKTVVSGRVPPVRSNENRGVNRESREANLKLPSVELPTRFLLSAKFKSDRGDSRNEWPIWVFPTPDLARHHIEPATADGTLPEGLNGVPNSSVPNVPVIKFASRFDGLVLDYLKGGGRVLMIPDGSAGSFPTGDQWFLKGGVASFTKTDAGWLVDQQTESKNGLSSIDLISELQHFDLSGKVVPAMDHFLDAIEPRVLLWDNHDQRTVTTQGLAFDMPVGKGRVLVSMLEHFGIDNAAGKWLLDRWLAELEETVPTARSIELGSDNLVRLQRELSRKGFAIHERNWKFHPDPEVKGLAEGWEKPEFDDDQWKSIRANRHWEGQGYADLDKWAWYRLKIKLPDDWNSKACFLNLTGLDDYGDIYLDGQKIGSCGNIETKETAFEQRESFDISTHVAPGKEFTLAIAVYDWYGAGGLFQPMTLSTEPIDIAPPMLK